MRQSLNTSDTNIFLEKLSGTLGIELGSAGMWSENATTVLCRPLRVLLLFVLTLLITLYLHNLTPKTEVQGSIPGPGEVEWFVGLVIACL